jgi:hypothetical protein
MANLHVMLSPDGDWDVREAEDGEILSHHPSRDQAVAAAEQLARERNGAELRIHEPDGEIAEREEVSED